MPEKVFTQKLSLLIKDNFALLVKKLASEKKIVVKFQYRYKPVTGTDLATILAAEVQAFYDFLQEGDETVAANRGTAVSALDYDKALVDTLLATLRTAILALNPEKEKNGFDSFIQDSIYYYTRYYQSAYALAEHIKRSTVQEPIVNALYRKNEKQQEKIASIKQEQKFKEFRITAAERRVILLVLSGKTDSEIAKDLHVTVNAVKGHLKHIYEKTGVHKRVKLCNIFRADYPQ